MGSGLASCLEVRDGLSSHDIEHEFPHEVPTALREIHRVLRPEGIAVVLCTNIQAVAEAVARGNLMDPLQVPLAQ